MYDPERQENSLFADLKLYESGYAKNALLVTLLLHLSHNIAAFGMRSSRSTLNFRSIRIMRGDSLSRLLKESPIFQSTTLFFMDKQKVCS